MVRLIIAAQLPFSALLLLLPSPNLDTLVNDTLDSMHTDRNVWEDRASINALVGSKKEQTDLKLVKSSIRTLCANPRLILPLK